MVDFSSSRILRLKGFRKWKKAKPVGIWIQVSTEDQAKGESPGHHEKRARFYAESKVKKVWMDCEVSVKFVRPQE